MRFRGYAHLRPGRFYAVASADAQGLRANFDPPFRVPIDRSAIFPSRAILDKTTLHLPDWSLIDVPLHERVVQDQLGAKSSLYMPLIREGECIGVLGLVGNRPNSFGPKEQAQAESFRDQAMIAIENARLFNEVQAKTRDLEESLAQQTATADVLKAISRSAFDLDTVLDTLISTAVRLCDATHGQIFRRHEDVYRYAASQMIVDPAYKEHERTTEIRAGRGTLIGRVALENRTVQIVDAWADPDYAEKDEARLGDVRSMLGVPLMRNGEPIGAFALARREASPYTPRQVELVQTFADQAVIAIENARLFGEVQAKTRDVEEALEDQIATSGVLQAIGASMADAQPVFDRIVDLLANMMPHDLIGVWLTPGDGQMRVAAHRASRAFDFEGIFPAPVGQTALAIADDAEQQFELADVLSAPNAPPTMRAIAERHGNFAVLITRMVWNERLIGTLGVTRAPGATFTARERKLLRTFADQAVIAIENARLFGEVQAKTRDLEESLAQQTATADVLKVISRSAFDRDAVLQTLIDNAVRLVRGSRGGFHIRSGDALVATAFTSNVNPELRKYLASTRWPLDAENPFCQAAREKRIVHIADGTNMVDETAREVKARAAFGAGLWVPLIADDTVIGVFGVPRDEPEAFTDREIELLQTFADQAVIAIENARLFGEVQAKTHDLEESLPSRPRPPTC